MTRIRKKHVFKILLMNAAAVLFLLAVAEGILRMGGPEEENGDAPPSVEPLFSPGTRHGRPVMENTFRSELEPVGAPMTGDPGDGSGPSPMLARVMGVLRFDRVKDPATYRIFILGTSPIWGFVGGPTGHTLMALYLEEILQARYPGRTFEVVNGAHVGFGAPEVLASLEEVLHYQPDLVAVYLGGVIPILETRADRDEMSLSPGFLGILRGLKTLHLFRAARDLFSPAPPAVGPPPPPPNMPTPQGGGPAPPPPVLIERKTELEWDPEGLPLFGPYTKPLEQPRTYDARMVNLIHNLQDEVEKGYQKFYRAAAEAVRTANVPTVFYSVATNIADVPPFWSIHLQRRSRKERKLFAQALEKGREWKKAGDMPKAAEWLEKAVRMGDTFAAAHFELGRVYRALGRHDEARAALRRAKEMDASNERALDRSNEILKKVAAQYDLSIIDTEALIRAIPASGGYLGNEVFLDYFHPKPFVVRRMAEDLADRFPELIFHKERKRDAFPKEEQQPSFDE